MENTEKERFCKNCNKKVKTQKMEANPWTSILLLMTTLGIGLFFYEYYCIKIKPKRCSICGKITILEEENNEEIPFSLDPIPDSIPNYCSFCGFEMVEILGDRCPNCNADLIPIFSSDI